MGGILLEVKLAALPEDAWEAGDGGVAEPRVIIADDVGDAVETPTPGFKRITCDVLQFGHGGDAVETGPKMGVRFPKGKLQFGHGGDAVETRSA